VHLTVLFGGRSLQPVSICLLQNILGELADGLEKLKKYGIFFGYS